MRLSFLLMLCVAAAGCERVQTQQQTDAGPLCPEGQTLVNGDCRVVCHRDGDCAEGLRCNLLVGACTPKTAQPDAGYSAPCTEGAVRCSADGLALEICSTDGVFVVGQQCPQPDGYCQNEQCLACQPGARRCTEDAGTAQVCQDNGVAWRDVVCAGEAVCVSGECQACAQGARRCNEAGDTLEECQRQADETQVTDWVPAGDNFDGRCITGVCELSGTVAACVAPACVPGQRSCGSATVQRTCNETGAWEDTECTTVPGMGATATCLSGVCVDECAEAVAAKSYFGCEYWSMIPDNSMDAVFKGNGVADSQFVYVVTNQSVVPATVTVYRHNGSAVVTVKTVTVPGRNDPVTRGLLKIPVPWHSISPTSTAVGDAITGKARIAYRLSSTKPITVYQFNPIDAEVVFTSSCDGFLDQGQCLLSGGTCVNNSSTGCHTSRNTYSNDASLLLPAHILGTSYVTLTPDHTRWDTTPSPGIYSIVASADDTHITIKSSAVTKAGTGVAAMAVDGEYQHTLHSYEVLQIASANAGTNLECTNTLCRVSNDLTGSVITSDKPIAVFVSSSCYQVPYNWQACDHVEEMLFPFETWGKNFVAVPSAPLRLNNGTIPAANQKPDHFKIVAGASTELVLTPANAATQLAGSACTSGSLSAGTCQLAGGRFIQFTATQPFTVTATNPIAVAQFFPGQGPIVGGSSGSPVSQGDPSMLLLPPVEQWRSRYTVLASTGLEDNYLGLAIDGSKVSSVRVDGLGISGFTVIPGTTFQRKNHPVTTGTHTIEVMPAPGQTVAPGAGVTVYGYDRYVSYGYTGGLDLQTIVTGVNPGG